MLRRGRDLSRPVDSIEFVVRDKKRERLDIALLRNLGWDSRSKIQRLVQRGRVKVNGEIPKVATRIGVGDVITIDIGLGDASSPSESVAVRPFWEDPYLVGVNKPPHVLVHPVGRTVTGTILDGLHAYFRPMNDQGCRTIVPKLCHRLDRETSGLLLVAKIDLARRKLSDAFENCEVSKRYLAVVEGRPGALRFTIDAAISAAIDRRKRHGNRLAKADPSGKSARTDFEVLASSDDVSVVECRPRTGRQNQIRIHLAEAGHPIVGDVGYGASADGIEGRPAPTRALLHSTSLRFEHPIWNTPLELEVPPPPDFETYFESLGLSFEPSWNLSAERT